MARAAPKKKTTSLSGSPLKKPIGRPRGSKNKAKAEPTRRLTAASVSKPAAAKKAAPAAPKMSKADLEAQVVKLERALARSRKQVAELKLVASDAGARAKQAEQAELVKPARTPAAKISQEKPAKQKPVIARGRGKKGEPEGRALDEVSGEAETEAHAS